MKDSTAVAIKDTVKGIGGIIGIQAIPSITEAQQDDIVRLFTLIPQVIIAVLTIISLIKSIFKKS
jgi:hypothetical protein